MRLRPGVVRDGIQTYLKTRGKQGATIAEIHAAVAADLGQDVAESSVRSYLNINTPERFERTGRGTYRLNKS